MNEDRRIPALIVAGYLGSGKTTLVDHLLRASIASGVRLAIVSNEFGDTGIDKALLEAGEDGFVELDGGCVCCRLSDALPATLQALIEKTKPDRLVLECSGVALPGEIVIQFWRPPLDALVSEEVVAVVVDADRTAATLAKGGQMDETWLEQLEAADLVVLNKTDQVSPEAIALVRAHIDGITQGQPIFPTTFGQVAPEVLFPPDPDGARTTRRDPDAVMHPHTHERFRSYALSFPDVVDEAAVLAEVAALDAIRAKGFVRTAAGVRVLQGVGPRIALQKPTRPVPEHLVGTVVVIHRDDG